MLLYIKFSSLCILLYVHDLLTTYFKSEVPSKAEYTKLLIYTKMKCVCLQSNCSKYLSLSSDSFLA